MKSILFISAFFAQTLVFASVRVNNGIIAFAPVRPIYSCQQAIVPQQYPTVVYTAQVDESLGNIFVKINKTTGEVTENVYYGSMIVDTTIRPLVPGLFLVNLEDGATFSTTDFPNQSFGNFHFNNLQLSFECQKH